MCAAKAVSARTGERQHAFTTGLSLRAASLPEGSASRDAGGGGAASWLADARASGGQGQPQLHAINRAVAKKTARAPGIRRAGIDRLHMAVFVEHDMQACLAVKLLLFKSLYLLLFRGVLNGLASSFSSCFS